MFLSCFQLDSRSPYVRKCLANAHDMHRSVMSGFCDVDSVTARRELGVLYRIWPKDREIRLYVFSKVNPDWSKLPEGFTLVGQPKNIGDLINCMQSGRRFGFDLLAIPGKKIAREGGNSRRVFIRTEEKRLEWLKRKAEQHGFSILWAREDGQIKAFVRGKAGCNLAVHTGIRYRGELEVLNSNDFKQAFSSGIGAGKAYGFGMLLLFKPLSIN